MLRGLFVLVFLGGYCGITGATNRCTMPDGKVVYQDAPCPSSARSAAAIRPTDNSVTGMPPEEARRRANAIRATNPDEIIAIKCAQDWPDDYRMQQFCRKQQAAGLRALDDPIPGASAEAAAVIRTKCASEWPDDYRMRAYCQSRQGKGIGDLQRSPPATTSDAAVIRAKCARDWPDDFRMRAYCEKRQIEALRALGR